MTDNPFEVFDSEDKAYYKTSTYQEKCWYRGKERIRRKLFL